MMRSIAFCRPGESIRGHSHGGRNAGRGFQQPHFREARQEIASLADAIDFLEEEPEDCRNIIHETALKACYDAHAGRKPLSAARQAFQGFAKRLAVLEDSTSAMQWIGACKSVTGKV